MFFHKKFLLLTFICFLLSVNFSKTFAETEIYEGSILEDTVWEKSSSPYIIYDDINVDSGTTLTIEPGVIVKIDFEQHINVLGTLIVNGTADEKVSFTSLYDDDIGGDSNGDGDQSEPSRFDWGGLYFSKKACFNIKNADIYYARDTIEVHRADGVIDSVNIAHSFSGLSVYDNASLEIKNSKIYDVLGGLEKYDNVLFFIYLNSRVVLDGVSIDDVPYGSFAVAYDKSRIDIFNSKITNTRGGVDALLNSTSTISNTVMENMESKIRAIFPSHYGSFMNISSSSISGVFNNSAYQSIFEVSSGSSLNFTDSSVKNITGSICSVAFDAFGGEKKYSTSTLNIENSLISDGDCTGLEISGKTEVYIKNTKINNFVEEGLSAFLSPQINISDSEISNNNYGIKSFGANLEIENSSIKNNNTFGIYNDPIGNVPTIKATGNWWGDKTGPYDDLLNASGTGNRISSKVDFVPWLDYNPIAGEKRNPVVIIPGILSSYLNKNDYRNEEVWVSIYKAIGSLGDGYLDDLIMTQFGKTDMTKTQVLPSDILRKINITGLFEKDFFDGLIKSLEAEGYVEGKDLFVFPYDWRLDIRESVNNTPSPLVVSLKDKIDYILSTTNSEKIDIIAHSMGGLLSKYYLKNFGQGKVEKFIDIATPHFGAPSAFGTLIAGDNFGIKLGPLGLNPNEVKKIIQNMPSVYQLLPSQYYFSDSLSDYKYYIDDLGDHDDDGIKGRLSFEESNGFIKNTGRNSYVLDSSIGIHDDIDNMNSADYGAEVYNIVGCGIPTVGKFFTLGKENNKNPEFDIAYISGDGTVPQRSAEGIFSTKQYYVTGFEHPTMPSSIGVKNLVPLILSGRQDSFDFNSYKNISTTTNGCELPNGSFLSFHNSVDVNIYDEFSNHTGPDTDGDLEENISSIVYNIIGDDKFIFLPENQNYQIKLQATALDSFSSYIKKIENGEIVSTSYFNDIPLISTGTKAEVKINTSNPEIILDSIGDGTVEEIFRPSSSLIGDSLNDRNTPVTELKVISPASSVGGSYFGNVAIDFNATDTESGLLKTEYSINGEDYAEATSTINVLGRGEVRVSYRSVDKAGNMENLQEIIFNIKDIPKQSHGRRSVIRPSLEIVDVSISTPTSTVIQVSDPMILVVDKIEAEDKNISNLIKISGTTTQVIVSKPNKLVVSPKVSTNNSEKIKSISSPLTLGKKIKSSSIKNIQPATVLFSSRNYKNSFFYNFIERVVDDLTAFSKKLFKM